MANSVERDRELVELQRGTKLFCTHCSSSLFLTKPIFELRFVQGRLIASGPEYYDVLDDSGDFSFEPHHLHEECWEEREETLREELQDVPPVQDSAQVFECDVCRSSIRELETFGLVVPGELQWSLRCPDGPALHLEQLADERHVCICCLAEFNRDQEFWDRDLEPLPGVTVCQEGIHSRCFRTNDCNCRSPR